MIPTPPTKAKAPRGRTIRGWEIGSEQEQMATKPCNLIGGKYGPRLNNAGLRERGFTFHDIPTPQAFTPAPPPATNYDTEEDRALISEVGKRFVRNVESWVALPRHQDKKMGFDWKDSVTPPWLARLDREIDLEEALEKLKSQ